MTMFKTMKSGILAAAAVIAATGGIASAQDISLDDILRQAREERRQAAQENREREQRFLAERNQQQARSIDILEHTASKQAIDTGSHCF